MIKEQGLLPEMAEIIYLGVPIHLRVNNNYIPT